MKDGRSPTDYENALPLSEKAVTDHVYIADERKKHMLDVLMKNNFQFEKDIASGITGTVAIFKYSGEDPDILKLARNGFVLIKLPAPSELPADFHKLNQDDRKVTEETIQHSILTYANEWVNIRVLNSIKSQNTQPSINLPETLAFELDGIKIIANQCIYYNNEPKTLIQHMRELGNTHSQWSASNKDVQDVTPGRTLIENARDQFDTIFTSAYESLYHLHQQSFLHRDFTGRNIALERNGESAKVIDLGTSVPCKSDGNALYHADFPRNPIFIYDQDALTGMLDRELIKREAQKPAHNEDHGRTVSQDTTNSNTVSEESTEGYPGQYFTEIPDTEINLSVSGDESTNAAKEEKHFSILTDLFSVRAAIIESLAAYCGVKNINMEIFMEKEGKKPQHLSNETRLLNAIERVEDLVKNMPPYDIRRKMVIQTLEKYRNYLTTMPQKGSGLEGTIVADKKLYDRCTLVDTSSIMARMGGMNPRPTQQNETIIRKKDPDVPPAPSTTKPAGENPAPLSERSLNDSSDITPRHRNGK